jgi:hypothetical protein
VRKIPRYCSVQDIGMGIRHQVLDMNTNANMDVNICNVPLHVIVHVNVYPMSMYMLKYRSICINIPVHFLVHFVFMHMNMYM